MIYARIVIMEGYTMMIKKPLSFSGRHVIYNQDSERGLIESSTAAGY
jgi:hypothetical protein